MKKFTVSLFTKCVTFLFLLVLVLSLCSSAFCEVSADIHTLWGIPWTTTGDELADAVYDASGVVVNQSSDILFFSDSSQKIQFLGLDASVLMVCDGESRCFSSAIFSFDGDSLSHASKKIITSPSQIDLPSLNSFNNLVRACVEKYGNPTLSHAYFYEEDGTSWESRNYLTIDSNISDDVYYSLKQLALDHNYSGISIEFSNISLSYRFNWCGEIGDNTSFGITFSRSISDDRAFPYVGSLEIQRNRETKDVNVGF